MNLPSLFDWLNRLDFLRGSPAAYLVVLGAVAVVLAWDWRLKLLALAAQYMVGGFLYLDMLEPRLANVKALTGLFVCLILYITARQVSWGRLPEDVLPEEAAQLGQARQVQAGPFGLPMTFMIRLFLTAVLLLLVWLAAARPSLQLPGLSAAAPHLTLAVYALIGLGLLSLALTTEPLSAGMGVLLFLAGVELYFSARDQSVTLLMLLAGLNLLTAVAISYLTQARNTLPAVLNDRAGATE